MSTVFLWAFCSLEIITGTNFPLVTGVNNFYCLMPFCTAIDSRIIRPSVEVPFHRNVPVSRSPWLVRLRWFEMCFRFLYSVGASILKLYYFLQFIYNLFLQCALEIYFISSGLLGDYFESYTEWKNISNVKLIVGFFNKCNYFVRLFDYYI